MRKVLPRRRRETSRRAPRAAATASPPRGRGATATVASPRGRLHFPCENSLPMLCDVRRRLADPTMWSLAGVVLAAALLRFSDLGARSFWRDEGATVELVRRSFVSMLRALPGSEGTPPLYYVLIWPWSRVFGSDEVGLRSFSALVGTATVLVVYAIAAELVSNRAALVVAGLSAVSPLLVWHSQDARSYAPAPVGPPVWCGRLRASQSSEAR